MLNETLFLSYKRRLKKHAAAEYIWEFARDVRFDITQCASFAAGSCPYINQFQSTLPERSSPTAHRAQEHTVGRVRYYTPLWIEVLKLEYPLTKRVLLSNQTFLGSSRRDVTFQRQRRLPAPAFFYRCGSTRPLEIGPGCVLHASIMYATHGTTGATPSPATSVPVPFPPESSPPTLGSARNTARAPAECVSMP